MTIHSHSLVIPLVVQATILAARFKLHNTSVTLPVVLRIAKLGSCSPELRETSQPQPMQKDIQTQLSRFYGLEMKPHLISLLP